jgi:anti-anti-sigma factor
VEIIERNEDGIAVFVLSGRVDSSGAVELDDILHRAVAEGKHNMILEMSGVAYMNSAGLRILADVMSANRERGGDLRLVGLNDRVRRVFEIIGFDKFFRVYNTVLEAMEGF